MAMLIPIKDINPHRRFPAWTLGLIAANVITYFATSASLLQVSDRAAFRYGAIPCDVMSRCDAFSAQLAQEFTGRSPLVSLFTSMFMHANLLHLGFNMLFLWVFGNNVEDRL